MPQTYDERLMRDSCGEQELPKLMPGGLAQGAKSTLGGALPSVTQNQSHPLRIILEFGSFQHEVNDWAGARATDLQ